MADGNRTTLLRLDPVDGFAAERQSARPVLWLTAATLLTALVWADSAPLEEVTRGVGKIAPLHHGQIIQSLEGGILKSLAVQEGEQVAAGQTLAVLDDTRVRTAFEDLQSQTVSLRAALDRLHAELGGNKRIEFDADVAEEEEIVEAETQLFRARRRTLVESTSSLRERIYLAEREIAIMRPLVERGAASAVELIRLERDATDLRGRFNDVENAYFQEMNDAIAKKRRAPQPQPTIGAKAGCAGAHCSQIARARCR